MPAPKDPIKYEEFRKKQRENAIKQWLDPEKCKNHKESMIKRSQNPEWQEMLLKRNKKTSQNPDWIKHNKEAREKMYKDPIWIENHKIGCINRSKTIDWIEHNKEAMIKRSNDPTWIKHHYEVMESLEWKESVTKANQLKAQDMEWLRKNRDAAQKVHRTPEAIENHTKANRKRAQDPEWINRWKEIMNTPEFKYKHKESMNNIEFKVKHVESLIGGFWYGSVKNDLSLGQLIRRLPEYKSWVKQVLERDEYKDKITGEFCVNPEAHHIVEVKKIIKKYNLKTLDDARKCEFLWDINNGECLEHENHISIHGFSYDEENE
jgi:hypothetical protein